MDVYFGSEIIGFSKDFVLPFSLSLWNRNSFKSQKKKRLNKNSKKIDFKERQPTILTVFYQDTY